MSTAAPPGPAGTTSGPPGSPFWQVPQVDNADRWLLGVASGIARELGVQAIVIRASFVLLFAAGGWAGIFYLFAWLAMENAAKVSSAPYVPQPKGQTTAQRHIGVGLVVLGLLLFLRLLNFGFVGGVVWPAGFVFMGALIAWSRLDAEGEGQGLSAAARVLAGIAVAIGGLIAFGAIQLPFRDAALVLIFTLALVAGIAVVAAPSLLRIGADLDNARKDKVRADERARVAAHLHDSVLQTLSLIQRHADDPATTSSLARRQERELRNWLYHSAASVGYVRLSHALNDMASQIEADHRVPVEVVVVGDEAFEAMTDKHLEALLGATREAITNAAKHSGAPKVDVFAEMRPLADSDAVVAEIFVRDTGGGFDRRAIDTERRGIIESIEGRMARHGGTAAIFSTPGEGTEVELSVTLTERLNETKEEEEA